MPLPPRVSSTALVFAWCGAVVFAGSLLFFFYCYLIVFGRPAAGPGAAWPIAIDAILFTVFALHHSVVARPAVKKRIARSLPAPIERSLYTWAASLLFLLVCAGWRGVPGELYHFGGPAAAAGYALQALAIWLTIRSSARLDVLDLAGVRPLLVPCPNAPGQHLITTGLYGFVRHPLYFSWALLVFAAPHMTMTRFTFAVLSTGYLAIAIPFEERSLLEVFGPRYRDYQRSVRWRMIPGVY
jgi:protein-S-isoprenylcysteine O-methyltransferase Ste14